MNYDKTYDFVIIGSGLGGLCCAYILADAGYSVVVCEKNNQLGGNLQVFSRNKVVFDTGVHYLGSLEKGQNLERFFRYFGIMDSLKIQRMDENAFDCIHFGEEKTTYALGQGWENYTSQLIRLFPEETTAIQQYAEKVREMCLNFPMYNVQLSDYDYQNEDFLHWNTKEILCSLTSNKRLQAVLAGNSLLYAPRAAHTPFYVHALIVNSYVQSAWKLVGGGSQIAKLMARRIRSKGGEIIKRSEMQKAIVKNGIIHEIVLTNGQSLRGKNFISNMHPVTTLQLVGKEHFRKSYISRIDSLEQTVSSFSLHIVFKKDTFPYQNSNTYHFQHEDDVWTANGAPNETWPHTFLFSNTPARHNPNYAESASILCYMDFEAWSKWENSNSTVHQPMEREKSYFEFKLACEQKVMDQVTKVIPHCKDCVEHIYSSTPITYRDYIGDPKGAMYGIQNDSTSPIKTMINPRTKISNLFLTGQNINLHGILGVTISAFVTCFNFVDKKTLLDNLNNNE